MTNLIQFPGIATSAPPEQAPVSPELVEFFKSTLLSPKNKSNHTWKVFPNSDDYVATIHSVVKWEKHGFARIYVDVVVKPPRILQLIETVTVYYDCKKGVWRAKEQGIISKLVLMHLEDIDIPALSQDIREAQ